MQCFQAFQWHLLILPMAKMALAIGLISEKKNDSKYMLSIVLCYVMRSSAVSLRPAVKAYT